MKIVGIVNITEDSFSDGGRFLATDGAIKRCQRLINGGVDVLELGPASSHPDAQPVSAEQEISRIMPVLDYLNAEFAEPLKQGSLRLSLDSFQATSHQLGLKHQISIINDIRGYADHQHNRELAATDCQIVLMFSIGHNNAPTKAHREQTDPSQVFEQVLQFFSDKIAYFEALGCQRERFILDPGMGFFLGANAETSLFMLKNLGVLKKYFNLPLMISVSRKSFIGEITAKPVIARGFGSLSAELYAAQRHADFIRTHDVDAIKDGLAIWNAIEAMPEYQQNK